MYPMALQAPVTPPPVVGSPPSSPGPLSQTLYAGWKGFNTPSPVRKPRPSVQPFSTPQAPRLGVYSDVLSLVRHNISKGDFLTAFRLLSKPKTDPSIRAEGFELLCQSDVVLKAYIMVEGKGDDCKGVMGKHIKIYNYYEPQVAALGLVDQGVAAGAAKAFGRTLFPDSPRDSDHKASGQQAEGSGAAAAAAGGAIPPSLLSAAALWQPASHQVEGAGSQPLPSDEGQPSASAEALKPPTPIPVEGSSNQA